MTNRFTLRMDQDDFNRSVEVTFEEEYLHDVLMQIDMFIRGCGYVVDGELMYMRSEDEYQIKVDETFTDYKRDVDMDGRC